MARQKIEISYVKAAPYLRASRQPPTFFSSASAGNKKTPEKEVKYARCSQGEMDDLADAFQKMFS